MLNKINNSYDYFINREKELVKNEETIAKAIEKNLKRVVSQEELSKKAAENKKIIRPKRDDIFVRKEINNLSERIENATIYTEAASKIIAKNIISGVINIWV